MIKKISLYKQSLHSNDHMVIVETPVYNPKTERILVSVNNKVADGVYNPKTKNTTAKLVAPSTNANHPLAAQLPQNTDMRVKVFVYDFVNDKILEAKLQEFSFDPNHLEYKNIDKLMTTLPVIMGNWDKKTLVEKAYFEEKIIKPKTKVNFTIGIFFDGTGNNRFNSEKLYYKNLDKFNKLNKKIPDDIEIKTTNGKIKIDNTSSYWNPYSNIVLLHDLYEQKNVLGREKNKGVINVVLKQYVEGIGTLEDIEDDISGSAFGEGENGVIGKVASGCNDLAINISKALNKEREISSITFDVFGFSRGAASARHFCNEILGSESIKDLMKKNDSSSTFVNQGNTRVDKKIKFIPVGKRYTLGLLGKALKNLKVQNEVKETYLEQPKITIRFLGLFDTVLSQFIVKDHLGKKLDLLAPITKIPFGAGQIIETKLDVIKQNVANLPIKSVVHFVAKDEFRENFASTRINVEKINKDKNRKGFEYLFAGVHSDIGGGYAAVDKDINILGFEKKTNFLSDDQPSPTKLENIRKFHTDNGYCLQNEIKINEFKTIETLPGEEPILVVDYQLIATRTIIPRYSIIPMYAMKALAELCGVVFKDETKSEKFPFEYEIPTNLQAHSKELLENIKNLFNGKKEKKMINKLAKNKYIHLSSNYNVSKIIKREGKSITGNDEIDKIFYINSPHYSNNEISSYVREIYTHNK
jgi:hypothetical protein